VRIPGIRYVQGKNAYSDGDRRKYGIAIHNTSNDASDTDEASYATWRPDGVSSHFYVDADSVTQSLDTVDRAGHAGSTHGNDHGISVEITGGNGKSRAWWLANVAWDKLGAVLAQVIRHHWPDGSFQVRRATVAQMKANPRVKALYGHDDMRRAWGGTDHTDPGPNFPWDRLIGAINSALKNNDQEDDVAFTDKHAAQLNSVHWNVGRGAPRLDKPGEFEAIVWWCGRVNRVLESIAARVDIGPDELAAIAAAVPQPDVIADAVVNELGGRPPAEVASSLIAALGRDAAAELVNALLAELGRQPTSTG
jgi:N-acetyl-anhydromuramyl-L-alanine amidase AmpD